MHRVDSVQAFLRQQAARARANSTAWEAVKQPWSVVERAAKSRDWQLAAQLDWAHSDLDPQSPPGSNAGMSLWLTWQGSPTGSVDLPSDLRPHIGSGGVTQPALVAW